MCFSTPRVSFINSMYAQNGAWKRHMPLPMQHFWTIKTNVRLCTPWGKLCPLWTCANILETRWTEVEVEVNMKLLSSVVEIQAYIMYHQRMNTLHILPIVYQSCSPIRSVPRRLCLHLRLVSLLLVLLACCFVITVCLIVICSTAIKKIIIKTSWQ